MELPEQDSEYKTGFAFSDEKTVVFFAHTHFGALQITLHEREFAIQDRYAPLIP